MNMTTSARNKLLVIGLSILFLLLVGLMNSRAGWGEGSTAANNVVAYGNTLKIVTSGSVRLSVSENKNVTDFALQLHSIGNWDTMIEGWTMRSTQNTGGSIVLGLRNQYVGATAAPIDWSPDGLIAAYSSGGRVDVSIAITGDRSMISVAKFEGPGSGSGAAAYSGANTSAGIGAFVYNGTRNLSFRSSLGGNTSIIGDPSTWGVWGGYLATDRQATYRFGQVVSDPVVTGSPADGNYLRVFRGPDVTFSGTSVSSFSGVWSGSLDQQRFNEIYKRTIGQGIELP